MHRAASAEPLAVWTDVLAMPLVPDEVSAREDAVRSVALLPDRDVRCDPFVLDQPAEELTGSVGGVGGEPLGPQGEALLGPVDHGLCCRHLIVGSGRRCFDIDDDGV